MVKANPIAATERKTIIAKLNSTKDTPINQTLVAGQEVAVEIHACSKQKTMASTANKNPIWGPTNKYIPKNLALPL